MHDEIAMHQKALQQEIPTRQEKSCCEMIAAVFGRRSSFDVVVENLNRAQKENGKFQDMSFGSCTQTSIITNTPPISPEQ